MKTTITQVMWYLSGGRDPGVHRFELPRTFGKIYNLKVTKSTAVIKCIDVNIPVVIRKFESVLNVNRMAIERTRPPNIFIPFHLTLVPVKGMTIPAIKARLRMIRVFPHLVINEINLEIQHVQNVIELISKKLGVFIEKMWQAVTVTVPMLSISSKVDIITISPDKIPGYFVGIKPTPISSMDRKELVLRRNGIADSLNAPRNKIDILAVFRNVGLVGTEKMEYDRRNKKLKLSPVNSKDFIVERFDVIVGLDKRSGKVHIAKYKGLSVN